MKDKKENIMKTFLVKLSGTQKWEEMQAESKDALVEELRAKNLGGTIKSKPEEEKPAMPRVHNKYSNTAPKNAVYIGRPSKWGNPFQIGRDGTREEVIEKHRDWILGNPELLAQIHELKDKDLVCYCSPQACHGDTLMELANNKSVKKKEDMKMLEGKFVIAGTGTRQLINEPQEYRHKVLNYMVDLLEKAKLKHGADNVVVISGMAEGFDEALARAAVIAKVPFIAAVPNKGYVQYYWGAPKMFNKNGKSGSRTGKSRYKLGMELLAKAAEVVHVCDGIYGEDGRLSNFIRNEWMADRASVVWVYNPNNTSGTQHCVDYCKKTGVRMFNIKVDKDDNGGDGERTTPPIEPTDSGHKVPDTIIPKKKKEVEPAMKESMTLENGIILNPEQAAAFLAITAGDGNVLLTGNAGTGKSFVTDLSIKALQSNGSRVAICATTGIAATHIGGKTYHSALAILPHLEFEEKLEAVRKKLKKERYDVIIIDEISMMSKEQFEEMDMLFRAALNNNKPFGGKRMVFIGDFLQCEPVEKGVADNLKGFAFESPIWNKAGFKTYQLKTVVRQRDAVFANFLNAIRQGIWVNSMMDTVNSRMNLEVPKEGVLRFMPTNNEADKINKIELDKLSGETFTYTAKDSLPPYAKPDYWDKQFSTVPRVLEIKIGAQVLHLVNEKDHGLVNGDVGTVTHADAHSIEVYWDRLNITTVIVPNEFSQEAPGVYYRRQMPLRVAYAITIHKSQGMTLDKAVMSLNNTFTDGQMYVALSRVRSLEGLFINSFDPNGVTANDKALEFYGLPGNLRGKEAELAYAEITGENNNNDEDGNGGITNETPKPIVPQGGNEMKKEENKVNYKNCFVKLEKLPEEKIDHIVSLLEQIEVDLESDVSNYAVGRKRLWLPYEAPLGNQPFKPGLLNAEIWQWIVDNCAKHGFTAQVALISKGGNINPHGDTTYAAPWAMGFNLGKCDWHIQTDRSAARTPAKPTQQHLDNFYNSETTAHFSLFGGEVFKFECKHEHAVTNAASDRWAINVWGIADGPTAQKAQVGERLQRMLDQNPEVQEFIENHQPGKKEEEIMTSINSFTGQYRWLSNFWSSPIQYGKYLFPTMEHYYQAMKTKNPKDRARIAGLAKAGEAKQAGKKLKVRDDWNDIKLDVMEHGLRIKFAPGTDLANKLIATIGLQLIEGNTWGDTFWGVCNGVGENNLGKLLMMIRDELMDDDGAEDDDPTPDNDPQEEEDMTEEEMNNCPAFDLHYGDTTVRAMTIKDMSYSNTYYMRKIYVAGASMSTKKEWYDLGARYIIMDNKTVVLLGREGHIGDEYIIPDFVAEWFFQEPVNDWNIQEPTKKRKEMNIKEYLVETQTICTEADEETLATARILTRIITNDPDHWLNDGSTVVLKEIDRGNYYYATLNQMFGKESFAVNVTAFFNPFDNYGQLTASHSATKPKEILFGWADFDSEVMIRVRGKNPEKMSDLSEYGLVVKNSAKMTKRFAEIIRPSRGFKVYRTFTNNKGEKKDYRLKKLILSKADMLKAFPHLGTEKVAGVANDGINIIATEVVKDAFLANPYMSPKDKYQMLKAIEEREITNLTLRLLSGVGLFKGNTLHNDREIINKRLRELGLGDGVTMYDIITGEDNVKDELATNGSFELLTLEPHHGPGPVKTNDQTLGQYFGIEGLFDVQSILTNFGHVLSGMEDDLYQGKDISWMSNIHPEPAKSEAEKVADIISPSVTSSVIKNIEILHSLGLDIGVSQMMMYMRAQGVIKMHLSKDSVKKKNQKAESRTFENWKASSREKKAHLYMPHAFRAYVMTKEMLYLLGYDIDLHDKEAFYHEETQTFAVTGLAWASIAPKLGGADLDDEVMVHERRYIRPDGTVNPLVAFLLRTPNDWAEFAIVPMADHGPAFVTEEEMPTINSADLAKFKQKGNVGVLPSKEPNSNQRPAPAVWDWSCVYYNDQCATVKGAGVGGQVKTKMLQYSTFNAPFADLVCANEDMIDALQQCKGTIEDLSAMNSWSDRAIMKILTEGKLDSYWWYSRNITGTISRLFKMYGFKSAKKPLHKYNSPIVTSLMIPREEMLWETYDRMVEFLNSNIKEIPELSVVFKKPVGNKPSDIEMRYRKLIYSLSKAFIVPSDTPEDQVGILLNDACVKVLEDFKLYIDKHGIEKAYVHILRMARASWLIKQDMPGVAFDKWLYSNANDVQYTMLEYFRDAMVWFREREEDKKK